MKIAHLILAHTAPVQLEKLIQKLAHPDADIYIHLDKKTAISDFIYLADTPNLYFIDNRVKVAWGSFTIVQATLNSFKEIINSGKDYDYLNLLSGQDYQLKSNQYIHRFLESGNGALYMNFRLMETEWRDSMKRVNLYHLNDLGFRGKFFLQRILNKILPRRKFPLNLVPVGRSQWFTIPLVCVKYICEYWEEYPELASFMKWTWAPDEFIFQTILYNSPYKSKMVNNDLRYIDWYARGNNPKTLDKSDVPRLRSSPDFWARKFDLNCNPDIFHLLDV